MLLNALGSFLVETRLLLWVKFECLKQLRAFEEVLHLLVFLALVRIDDVLCPRLCFIATCDKRVHVFSDSLVTALLKECHILAPFVADLDSEVSHTLSHLLELVIVIVDGLVAALVSVPYR